MPFRADLNGTWELKLNAGYTQAVEVVHDVGQYAEVTLSNTGYGDHKVCACSREVLYSG